MTSPAGPLVHLVDDDAAARRALGRLLRAAGYRVEESASAEDHLKRPVRPGPACLVLDVFMPGMSGLNLQETLNALEDRAVPIVFVSGSSDIPASVRAMKAGAVDFLVKPVEAAALLAAVRKAVRLHRGLRKERMKRAKLAGRLDVLTSREREVLVGVVTGLLNKQIAGRLGISEKTVKVHRGRVMRKLDVRSVAELVRLAQEAGVSPSGTVN